MSKSWSAGREGLGPHQLAPAGECLLLAAATARPGGVPPGRGKSTTGLTTAPATAAGMAVAAGRLGQPVQARCQPQVAWPLPGGIHSCRAHRPCTNAMRAARQAGLPRSTHPSSQEPASQEGGVQPEVEPDSHTQRSAQHSLAEAPCRPRPGCCWPSPAASARRHGKQPSVSKHASPVGLLTSLQ